MPTNSVSRHTLIQLAIVAALVAGQLTGAGISTWSAAMVCGLSSEFVSAAVYALLNARSREDELAPIAPIPCGAP